MSKQKIIITMMKNNYFFIKSTLQNTEQKEGHTGKAGLQTSGHLGFGRLDSGRLEAWTLIDWTLGLCTPGPEHLDSGRLESERLDAWTLDAWTSRANLSGPHSQVYFIEGIHSNVAIFRNFILTQSVTL